MLISVIGTAGRKPYTDLMTYDLYCNMYRKLRTIITEVSPVYEERILVSGGAAYSDHLAIDAFKRIAPSLHLHLPAQFDLNTMRFAEASRDGQTSNYYHDLFSKKCGFNSLDEIGSALQDFNCTSHVYNGFFARNIPVGRCDILIAFTWGEGSIPADGGTKHTWDHSSAPKKIHVPLKNLQQ